ncbi:MAG: DUF1254 domain-containing protein [Ignavibacteria bacterium]|nr:DUF1254 domain-containing protein [Ignavibacteria bacterium]
MKIKILSIVLLAFYVNANAMQSISRDSIIAVARDAYVYGYPLIENYRVIYNSTQNKNYATYAPFNTFYNAENVATPLDTLFVSPNVDTPYSYGVIDVRYEPVVITIPAFEKKRYIGVPLYDMYTHIIYTISPKNNGNEGGSFLLANMKWNGEIPAGIKKVIRTETDFVYTLIRTQLFGSDDLENVHKLQSQFKIQQLSEYLGKGKVIYPEPVLIKPIAAQTPFTKPTVEFFEILNFVLKYCDPHPDEANILKRFGEIGIEAGKPFAVKDKNTEEALIEGIMNGQQEFLNFLANLNSSKDLFGSREYLKQNYIGRAVGAWTGIYANEYDVFMGLPGFEKQSNGQPFSGKNKYTFTFEKGKLPPVDAFWSITLYKLPSRFLYANKINRYVINSPMVPGLKTNEDGSITIYIQNESPGAELESNWLPCPAGDFAMSFRTYLPREEIRDGSWQPPIIKLTF